MFLLFSNAIDERIPHSFILSNPLYVNGYIKKWDIEELDLLQSDRDDEITVYRKFR